MIFITLSKMINIVICLSAVITIAKGCGLDFQPLNETTEICCNGMVYDKYEAGKERSCCTTDTGKGSLFFVEEQYCCAGILRRVLPGTKHHNPFCCGTELIPDDSEEICCKGLRFPSKEYWCDDVADILLRHDQFACYNKFKPEEYEIYSADGLGTTWTCCGKNQLSFNNNTHECLDDEEIVLKNLEFCKGKPYFEDKHVCCHDTGKLIPHPDNIMYNEGVHPYGSCVNDQYVDNYKEEIVRYGDGGLIAVPRGTKACARTYYDNRITNPDVQIHCCDDVLNYNPLGSDVQCCGNKTIPNSMTCCNNAILPLGKKCCGNSVYEPSVEKSCCVNQLIDKTTHLCCGDGTVKEKRHPLDDHCCGNETYNSGQNFCCGRYVVDTFDTSTHECVNGQVQEKIITNTIKKVSQTIHNTVSNTRHTQTKNGLFKDLNDDCLSCPMYLKPDMNCTKRYEYRFYLLKKEEQSMDVVILSPKYLEGNVLTLRSKDMCPCLEQGKSYSIFTNRFYGRRMVEDQVFRLKFSRRDIITKLSMRGTRMRPALQCKIDRYHREPRS